MSSGMMNKKLLDLFVDRTKIDTSLARLITDDGISESLKYKRCKNLNDEDTIKFKESLPFKHDIDEKYNMFVSLDDNIGGDSE